MTGSFRRMGHTPQTAPSAASQSFPQIASSSKRHKLGKMWNLRRRLAHAPQAHPPSQWEAQDHLLAKRLDEAQLDIKPPCWGVTLVHCQYQAREAGCAGRVNCADEQFAGVPLSPGHRHDADIGHLALLQ